MTRPQLPALDVRKVLAAKGITVPGVPVAVLGVRGYYRDSMGAAGKNDRGIYDDAAFIVKADHVEPFNFNTDPSAYRNGIATLKPGVWKFIAGKHHISEPPPRGYAAFRQFGTFTVTRDNKGEDTGDGFAINLHRGGVNGTSSLGCQTVPPEQWEEFRDSLYKSLGTSVSEVLSYPSGVTGKIVTYCLVIRDEVEKILGCKL